MSNASHMDLSKFEFTEEKARKLPVWAREAMQQLLMRLKEARERIRILSNEVPSKVTAECYGVPIINLPEHTRVRFDLGERGTVECHLDSVRNLVHVSAIGGRLVVHPMAGNTVQVFEERF